MGTGGIQLHARRLGTSHPDKPAEAHFLTGIPCEGINGGAPLSITHEGDTALTLQVIKRKQPIAGKGKLILACLAAVHIQLGMQVGIGIIHHHISSGRLAQVQVAALAEHHHGKLLYLFAFNLRIFRVACRFPFRFFLTDFPHRVLPGLGLLIGMNAGTVARPHHNGFIPGLRDEAGQLFVCNTAAFRHRGNSIAGHSHHAHATGTFAGVHRAHIHRLGARAGVILGGFLLRCLFFLFLFLRLIRSGSKERILHGRRIAASLGSAYLQRCLPVAGASHAHSPGSTVTYERVVDDRAAVRLEKSIAVRGSPHLAVPQRIGKAGHQLIIVLMGKKITPHPHGTQAVSQMLQKQASLLCLQTVIIFHERLHRHADFLLGEGLSVIVPGNPLQELIQLGTPLPGIRIQPVAAVYIRPGIFVCLAGRFACRYQLISQFHCLFTHARLALLAVFHQGRISGRMTAVHFFIAFTLSADNANNPGRIHRFQIRIDPPVIHAHFIGVRNASHAHGRHEISQPVAPAALCGRIHLKTNGMTRGCMMIHNIGRAFYSFSLVCPE